MHLEMMWMMLTHWKWMSCFETKRKHLFLVIFGTWRWFCTFEHYKEHFQSWKSMVLLRFTWSIQWWKALRLFLLKKSRKCHRNGIVHCHHPSSIVQKAKSFRHAGLLYQNLNEKWTHPARESVSLQILILIFKAAQRGRLTVGAANIPACQQVALPARTGESHRVNIHYTREFLETNFHLTFPSNFGIVTRI